MSKDWKDMTFDQKVNKLAKGIKYGKRTFDEKVNELKSQASELLDTIKEGLDEGTIKPSDDVEDILDKLKK